MPRRPSPPAPLPRKPAKPKVPAKPMPIQLSRDWSIATRLMWQTPVEHGDELAEHDHEGDQDHVQ
jgi:hypothetical protein